MSRYALLVLSLILFFLAAFLVAAALEVPLFTGTEWIQEHAWTSAVVILNGLLIGDVLLPIPSSLLMVANGALLGTVGGAIATIVSTVLGGALAFWLGRRGAPWLLARISERERARADRFFSRWGAMAVLVSRPVPIIAETIAILAGTTPMGWRRFLLSRTRLYRPPIRSIPCGRAQRRNCGNCARCWRSRPTASSCSATTAR